MEAGVQALKVTAFLRFPKTFIFGNIIIDVALHFYTGKYADKVKTMKYAFDNPNTAFKVGDIKPGSHLLANNTSRFQSSLSDGYNNGKSTSDWEGDQSKLLEFQSEDGEFEGTQSNAYRHALWQAEVAEEYGSNDAKKIGDAHEKDSNMKYKEGV